MTDPIRNTEQVNADEKVTNLKKEVNYPVILRNRKQRRADEKALRLKMKRERR